MSWSACPHYVRFLEKSYQMSAKFIRTSNSLTLQNNPPEQIRSREYLSFLDFQLQSVQAYETAFLNHIQIDDHCPFECEVLQIGLQGEVVVSWYDIARQDLSALVVDCPHLYILFPMHLAHVVSSVRTVSNCGAGGWFNSF
jgi:hypothetical protein